MPSRQLIRSRKPPRGIPRFSAQLLPLLVTLLLVSLCRSLCPGAAMTSAPDDAKSRNGLVVGVDLGVTHFRIAVRRDDRVEIIPHAQEQNGLCSRVSQWEQETLFPLSRLSRTACPLLAHVEDTESIPCFDPSNMIFAAKAFLRGISHDDVGRTAQRSPFAVSNSGGDHTTIVTRKCQDRVLTPQRFSPLVFHELKETAEAYLGERITRAVVTVPSSDFDDAQRAAIREAGRIAGVEVIRVLNEPIAAAIAYGKDKKIGESHILVYDLSGHALEVTLLWIDDGVFEALATACDPLIGGEAFNDRVVEYLATRYMSNTGKDISEDPRAVHGLYTGVEKAKRELSTQESASLEIQGVENGSNFMEILTRAEFEEVNMDLFKKTLENIEHVLKAAQLSRENIDEIILVGGSTKIPKVQQLLKNFFNGKTLLNGIDPAEVVAYGAAVWGDEMIWAEYDDIGCLVDVVPTAFGVKTHGGVFTELIPRNSVMPTKKSQMFSTAVDNQSSTFFQIYAGVHPLTESALLGGLELSGIPPAPRGVPRITVTFAVDVNGNLNVSAVHEGGGASKSIFLDADQVLERIHGEAEQFATENEA